MRIGVIEPSSAESRIRAGETGASGDRRPRLVFLSFALYLSTLSIDAVRKVTALPVSALGVIYVITILIYVMAFPRPAGPGQGVRRTLPLWLWLLSMWCLAVALTQHIPHEMALLGWASYVFFVPLAYVGAALAADATMVVKVLRAVTLCGAVIGASTVIGAVLGSSAPALLQPIIPSVGIHSFNTGSVYLSPSIFASAEEASEQLLIAFFAWVALAHLSSGRFRRMPSAMLGALIVAGLLFTARRADIYVAGAGILAVLLLDRSRAGLPAERGHRGVPAEVRGRLGLAVLVVVAASAGLASWLAGGTLRSFLVSGSSGDRISQMFSLTDSGSLLGQGPGTSTQGISLLGSAQSGSRALSGTISSYVLHGRIFTSVEGGLAKTWLELGIIGVVLYTAVFLSVLSPAIRSLRRLDGVGTALTALAIALGVIFMKGHQSLDDPLIQPLFWLTAGGIWGRVRPPQAQPATVPSGHELEHR